MKVLLACASLLLAVAASANVPKEWRARYQAIDDMLQHKRLQSFRSLYADDFYSVGPKKEVQNRGSFFKEIEDIVLGAAVVRVKSQVKNVYLNGKLADVEFVADMTLLDKNGKGATIHEVGTDRWRLTDDTWLCFRTYDSLVKVIPVRGK